MISEGVDIPRAACLAWMTSYRTPLFFAQGVGRVVRARSSMESATVFLPAVRPLLALAAELEDQRNHVIPPPDPGSALLDIERPEAEPGDTSRIEVVDSDASFAHVLHAGRAVVADRELSADDHEFLGLPGLLSPEQTATLLAHRDAVVRRRVSETAGEPAPAELAGWRAGAALRAEVNRLVGVLASRSGTPHRQLHAELRRAVPGPPSAAADSALLERRRDQLMEWLGGG